VIVKILTEKSVVLQGSRKDWEERFGDLEGCLVQSGNSWLTHEHPQNEHSLLVNLNSL
jgi:hypothetical protein